jgi:type II secretory pathway pseudopilin PulG
MRACRARPARRGLTAVAVLVCLVIVTMISGALLKIGVAHRDFVRGQERKLQAEWLAQSGIDRARARLAVQPDYTGETWKLAPRDLNLSEPDSTSNGPAALVHIAVERPENSGNAQGRLIKVQADYPPDAPRRARHSTQILVELNLLNRGVSR